MHNSVPYLIFYMPFDNARKLIQDLQSFDFGEELQNIVSDNSGKLTEMVKDQLTEGESGDEKPSTIFGRRGYSPRTVAIKEANGQGLGAVTDRVTNYMTGAFYESLRTNTEDKVFETDSDVPYFADIQLYSRDSLLEVGEENRKEFGQDITLPGIKKIFKEKTGLIIT